MKQERWTKQCKCGNFMPAWEKICDRCLLSKYLPQFSGRYDSCDPEGRGTKYYTEEDVVIALRRVEMGMSELKILKIWDDLSPGQRLLVSVFGLPTNKCIEPLTVKDEDIIWDVVSCLTPKEARVLELRLGRIPYKPIKLGKRRNYRTLKEVGIEFGVTQERIRQIEAKAMRKLRHPSRNKPLKRFISDEKEVK